MKLTGLVMRAGRRAREYHHFRVVAEVVAGVLLLSSGAAAAATVAPDAAGTTIHGCENTKTGALTVLLKSGAKCARGTTALSWNTAGPRGPKGPAGTAALFGKKTGAAVQGTGATCTTGEVILSAGRLANGMPARGQILLISQNQALFSLIGTKYGGNGTSTFALPNLTAAAPDGLTYSICVSGDFPQPS
jgi:hypothetical protein